MAQFTREERIQGYKVSDDLTTFIFDPKAYDIKEPLKVVITGSFVSWSSDMNDTRRILKKQANGFWSIQVENKDYDVIPPSAAFKFRINEGKWLDPPTVATYV